jgi:hypothetical protein
MPRPPGGVPGQTGTVLGPFLAFAWRVSMLPAPHALLTESGEPDDKENDMTDTAKKPIDDSKEELTEAELEQVAGGIGGFDMVEKKHTQPEVLGNKSKDGSIE